MRKLEAYATRYRQARRLSYYADKRAGRPFYY